LVCRPSHVTSLILFEAGQQALDCPGLAYLPQSFRRLPAHVTILILFEAGQQALDCPGLAYLPQSFRRLPVIGHNKWQ
jgi:hypothetical protein